MEINPSDRNPGSKNILLVDDERLILSSLARRMRGHTVFKALDVLSALGQLEEVKMDLVLTDYRMPGGDGITLLDIVRRRYPHVRRTMMSADPPLNLAELIHAGVVEHFFPKPFGLSMVTTILDLVREKPAAMGLPDALRAADVVEHYAAIQ